MDHPHTHDHNGVRHICMMEGPDPELVLSTVLQKSLSEDNKRQSEEIKRLKALLATNNIPYNLEISKKPRNNTSRHLRSRGAVTTDDLTLTPHLPNEVLLNILSFALTSPEPIIDPFYKFDRQNITKAERRNRKNLNFSFIATSKLFHKEGSKFLVSNNTFIFTQIAALENFANVSPVLRSTVQEVTFRVVGRYYDDVARKLNLDGGVYDYHPSVSKMAIPVLERPAGMIRDGGIQAYCWYQVADFLKPLALPNAYRTQLFPKLQSLRLDLVNFCGHLLPASNSFASLVRWHIGKIVDELIITGVPETGDAISDEESILRNLIRDEGLFSTGGPIFISKSDGLKSLAAHGYFHQVVRADKPMLSKDTADITHPEGGKAPASMFPAGKTIWKWVADSPSTPKAWVEFHRASGYPADHIDWSDFDEEEDDDEFSGSDQESEDVDLPLPI